MSSRNSISLDEVPIQPISSLTISRPPFIPHSDFIYQKFPRRQEKKRRPNNVQEFAETVSLPGIRFWLSNEKSRSCRVIYFLIWFGLATAACYLFASDMQKYFRFDTKVSISKATESELKFPGITICPDSHWRKSVVAGSPVLAGAASGLYFVGPDQTRTCSDPKEPQLFPDADTLNNFWFSNTLRGAAGLLTFGLDDFIKKCYWMNTEVPCKNLFFTHFSETGLCFTFNYAGIVKSTPESFIWVNETYERQVMQNSLSR